MHLRRIHLILVVVITIILACQIGLTTGETKPEAALKTSVDRPIRGKVVDAETEKPIQNFTVLLSPPVRDYFTDPRSPEFKISATYEFTTETGEFQITDFTGDACGMVVKADGYVHGIVWDYIIRGPKQSKLSELWTEQPLVFKLRPGGVIQGRVVQADAKKPVANATVVLNEPMEGPPTQKLSPDSIAKGWLAETKTDANGAFALDGIAFKTYRGHRLRVTHPRFLAKELRGLQLNAEQPQIKVEIALEPAAGVSGVVLDSAGKPVEGANVIASVRGKIAVLQSKTFVNFATTDEKGHFEVGSLQEGVCSVSAMFSRPGVISILGFAKDVQLKKGTITEVNLRPIKDAATLLIKVVEEFPAFVFVCTSSVGKQAYGLLNAEDGRLFALGIDCIATGMLYQGVPAIAYTADYKQPEELIPFLSPNPGDIPSEESLTLGTCKIQNLPPGTFFIHAGAMTKGCGELLVGGTSVNLTTGKSTEVTIDLSSAVDNPRKPLAGDPEKVIKRMEAWQEQPKPEKPRKPEPQNIPPRPTITNSIGMKFIHIPAGSFRMGSSISAAELARRYQTQASHFYAEEPQHPVTISRDFYLSAYEVTQAQWRALMGNNPAAECPHGDYGIGDEYPVYWVSWDHCQEFIQKLNEKENTTAYRLPTEAEREYACRVGSTTLFHFGDSDSDLGDYAWYKLNSGGKCHPVGLKKPNAWGLYDMMGNVTEWCQDGRWNYPDEPQIDPVGPASSYGLRIRRGASWVLPGRCCRSADRSWGHQDTRYIGVGFRLAKDLNSKL